MPGFLTVVGAGALLRLAPRSVRDLIYSGRLPSARLGRRHFLRIADVELERRRRLGLPLPAPRRAAPRRARRTDLRVVPTTPGRRAIDQSTRRERALERAALRDRWLRAHHAAAPSIPFLIRDAGSGAAVAPACVACERVFAAGERLVVAPEQGGTRDALCRTCARRAVLAWADARHADALAARRFARELGVSRQVDGSAAEARFTSAAPGLAA